MEDIDRSMIFHVQYYFSEYAQQVSRKFPKKGKSFSLQVESSASINQWTSFGSKGCRVSIIINLVNNVDTIWAHITVSLVKFVSIIKLYYYDTVHAISFGIARNLGVPVWEGYSSFIYCFRKHCSTINKVMESAPWDKSVLDLDIYTDNIEACTPWHIYCKTAERPVWSFECKDRVVFLISLTLMNLTTILMV